MFKIKITFSFRNYYFLFLNSFLPFLKTCKIKVRKVVQNSIFQRILTCFVMLEITIHS